MLRSFADVTLLQMTYVPLMLMEMASLKKEFPEHFGSQERIKDFFEQLRPTHADVIRALKGPKNASQNERKVMSNMKNWIRKMTKDDLRRFLRFVTGSTTKPREIVVEFHQSYWPPIRSRMCGSLISISMRAPPPEIEKALKEAMNMDVYQPLIDMD
jgi:hypothetical protein